MLNEGGPDPWSNRKCGVGKGCWNTAAVVQAGVYQARRRGQTTQFKVDLVTV